MKSFAALCLILAVSAVNCGVIPATTFVRTPSHDSAIIKSDRLGGNFAYSTVEGHAYAAVSPVVQRITEPVGVSYTAHQVNLGHIATPVAVSQPIYAQHSVFAQPIYPQHQFIHHSPAVISAPAVAPVLGQAPIYGGIASTPVGAAPIAPIAPAAPAAPAPVPGTVLDADTVAVESA